MTPAGGLTILEVPRHPLEHSRALERVMFRTWPPACNTRGLHETGSIRPRQLRRRPRERPPSHVRTDCSRLITSLDSLSSSVDKEELRWQTCRTRWLKRQQTLLQLTECEVLSVWRFARQMPRPGVRTRLLKRCQQHIASRGWPVPGRRENL